jgi:EmrB/QacA subfamily drug resistance transporter
MTSISLPQNKLSTALLWVILCVILIADMLDLLDSSITFIAAPTIVREIGGGTTLIKWLGAGYSLNLGIFLVIGGRLGDRFGQRRLFLAGIAGFTLASLACGLSTGPTMLIIARLIQGAAGALMIPQGIAIMTKTFPREFMAKSFSAFGPALGVAAVAGPILAGFIIDANIAGLTWRPMFLINIILGSIGLIAAMVFLPRTEGDSDVRLDWLGSCLLAGMMFSLLYGLIEGSNNNWNSLSRTLIGAGIVAFVLFAWRQVVAQNPLIMPTLLRNRGFTSGLVLGLAFFAVVNGLIYVVSLFFQSALHLTAKEAAIALCPDMLGIIIASIAAPMFIEKLGRILAFIGLLLTLVGTTWALIVTHTPVAQVTTWSLAPAILVLGLGMGFCFGTIFDVALGTIAPHEAGSASGALSAVQQLAGSIGTATMTSVYFHFVGTDTNAMTVCLLIAICVILVCCGLLWLLPEHAQAQDHER